MAKRTSSPPSPARLSRRRLLQGAAALPLAGALRTVAGDAPATRRPRPHVAVVGAGAFGGWSAYHLLRSGARVTLLDAWGPGNRRASSGGESRVIRAVYGPSPARTDLALRAFDLWRQHEARWRRRLVRRTGALWLTGDDDPLVQPALPLLEERGIAIEELTLEAAGRRYPQVDFDGVERVFEDADTGYLPARQACQEVVARFVDEGGIFRQLSVEPGPIASGSMGPLRLSDGSRLAADAYLFACGSWLATLFPEVLGGVLTVTRQEVFFFGTPAGDVRFSEGRLPIWADLSSGRLFYGVPANPLHGFKFADDTPGEAFDPTAGDRSPTAEGLRRARAYLGRRFPALAGAPLLGSRVCHYSSTPDAGFVVDRHPEAGNAWLLGGGSGHGFKHGPALGEKVAVWVLGDAPAEPEYALARFAGGAPA